MNTTRTSGFLTIHLLTILPLRGALASSPASDEDKRAVAISSEPTRQCLSPEQEQTALRLIDNICGDTWCEGEYDWRFDKLTCNFSRGTCTLRLRSIDWSSTPPDSKAHVCRLAGFTSYDELVDTQSQELTTPFFEAVGQCIEDIESGRSSARELLTL